MNDKHPHYDVIVAWAEGKTIQTWSGEDRTWYDWTLSHAAPCFYRDNEYRVKPKTFRYRTYLLKACYNDAHYVESVSEAANKRHPRPEWPQFVRWLGDWQEVEI